MKKILSIFILYFLFTNTIANSQSGWIVSNINFEYFSSIHYFDQNTGLLTNSNGIVYKSTNGGVNWNISLSMSGINIYSAYYFNVYNYVFAGSSSNHIFGWIGLINNGVQTHYYFTPSLTYMGFQTTDWLNQDTGYIGGYDMSMGDHIGRAFKTTNKGVNWIEITPGYCLYVYRINFVNSNTGYLLCHDLYKTTNMGNNWTSIYNASGSGTVFDICIINSDTMYLAGLHGNIVMTSNGGVNWSSRNTGKDISINKMGFINSKTGWICGDSGLVMKTTNVGINWQRQNTGTNRPLRDLCILNENYLWAAGDSGVVLRTTTGGVSFVNKIGNEIPKIYKLSQNYPNPFNPSTNIKYQIANSSYIILKVYDILGKEVATLVNEKQKPGTYEVTFDGNNLSSGIYFYKLQVGHFVQVKKMVLIK
jgi:photosystem II stability/assembly factor-like uncharacterized protein